MDVDLPPGAGGGSAEIGPVMASEVSPDSWWGRMGALWRGASVYLCQVCHRRHGGQQSVFQSSTWRRSHPVRVGAHKRSRASIRLTVLFAAVWLSRIPQTSAPVAPAEVFAAVKAGQSLADTKRRLHVAALSMMVGGDCSAADACWVVAQDALDVVAEDGTILRSVLARDLLSYYARGKGMAYKKTEHLVKEELLDVLWAVDPHSFFFAYVDADARKLVAVQPPARVGAFRVPVTRSKAAQARVVAGDAWADELLPAGVKFQRLVLVLRKHGLLMLLADADDTCFAHLLALRLGDPSPSGRTWPDVNTDATPGSPPASVPQSRVRIHNAHNRRTRLR